MKTAFSWKPGFSQLLLLVISAGLMLPTPWLQDGFPNWIRQITGLILASAILLTRRTSLPIPTITIVFAFISICLLGLYLIPLPLEIWLQLPGRAFYQEVVQLLEQTGHGITQYSISIDAYATAKTLLAILPALGMFFAASALNAANLQLLVKMLVATAVYQALWGLAQSSTGMPAHGSYINRDHYVALMEVSLPLALALFSQALFQQRHTKDTTKQWVMPSLYGFAVITLLLAGLFSLSRAGIGGIMIALLLSLPILTLKFRWQPVLAAITAFFLLAMLFVASAERSIIPIVNRFLATDPLADARWVMFEQTLKGIAMFFPLGSGPGTFPHVYAAVQPMAAVGDKFVDHAHNDYLEFLLETGLVGVIIVVGFFAMYLWGWIKLMFSHRMERYGDGLHLLKIAAGTGVLAGLFHAFFDFNFHQTPYPIHMAFLCAIFFRKIKEGD